MKQANENPRAFLSVLAPCSPTDIHIETGPAIRRATFASDPHSAAPGARPFEFIKPVISAISADNGA